MSGGFSPCLYNFTVPDGVETGVPLSPPLWAMIDHIVAVAYHLHVTSDRVLVPDASQLQWALGFLCSQDLDSAEFPNLSCLKNMLHASVLSKFRSPQFLDEKSSPGDMNLGEAEVETASKDDESKGLSIPLTLMDILTQQPEHLRIKAKKDLTTRPGENECSAFQKSGIEVDRNPAPRPTILYSSKPSSTTKWGESQKCRRREDVMSMNRQELSQYLHTLKENQRQILMQEQKHLAMLDSIIDKIN